MPCQDTHTLRLDTQSRGDKLPHARVGPIPARRFARRDIEIPGLLFNLLTLRSRRYKNFYIRHGRAYRPVSVV